MRALVITQHGPPEVLKVLDRPDPDVGPGQVRVAVKAAGINFSDLLARIGTYSDAPKPPCVIGYEVAGDVESIGDGVEGIKPGDRVIAGSRFGGQAELVTVNAADVVPLPEDWSYEKGAALPVVYATAYAGLIRYGNVLAGERVLIHAAAGGVGIAAIQIAKHLGAELYGTASASKHDANREQGIEHAIDYHSQDFVQEVRRITGEKQPLDLVMDAVGGNSFRKSWSLLRAGGRLVAYGVSESGGGERREVGKLLKLVATSPVLPILLMMRASKSVIALNMLTIWDVKGSLDEFIGPLRDLTDKGVIDPVVAEAFPIEQAADAHRYLGARKNIGKVVLTF